MSAVLAVLGALGQVFADGAEACACGASIRWRGPDTGRQLRDWRTSHRCKALEDSDDSGSKHSQIERVGFACE